MLYLNDLGLLCTLGDSKLAVTDRLIDSSAPLPDPQALLTRQGEYTVGEVRVSLPPLPVSLARYDCRNNRLAAAALKQIRPSIDAALQTHGAQRLGVVMATSTSGIAETERAVKSLNDDNVYPPGYHPVLGMLGGLAEFVALYLGAEGPAYAVSTACSSSANAVISARRLINLGLCDAVVVGGVDSLCQLTLKGFAALEAQSAGYCKPFTGGRDGINIGEGAAVFLMSREPRGVAFVGGAGSSDAYHVSAPEPEGEGAYRAMSDALADARLVPGDIGYLNLHGTATPHNDLMESKAVYRLFGEALPCSSTKSMTGHTLGAAGALELGFCWLLLLQQSGWRLPPSLYPEERDDSLPPIGLAEAGRPPNGKPRYCMSNSFAFGGSNVSLIIGADHD